MGGSLVLRQASLSRTYCRLQIRLMRPEESGVYNAADLS
jgi:hypothetical protein